MKGRAGQSKAGHPSAIVTKVKIYVTKHHQVVSPSQSEAWQSEANFIPVFNRAIILLTFLPGN